MKDDDLYFKCFLILSFNCSMVATKVKAYVPEEGQHYVLSDCDAGGACREADRSQRCGGVVWVGGRV